MSIPNKVTNITINNNICNINIDDNISTIYDKIINTYYNTTPILHKHLYVWMSNALGDQYSIGFNYKLPENKKGIIMENPFNRINIDNNFITSSGDFIVNQFSFNMNLTLQDYIIKYNNKKLYRNSDNKYDINEILFIDIFSVINQIKPMSKIEELKLFNGFFRKYWKFIDEKDIILLKTGYENISNYNKYFKRINTSLYKHNKISELIKHNWKDNYANVSNKINLMKININIHQNIYIDLLNIFIKFKLTKECPFMKLHLLKNIHVKIFKENIQLYKHEESINKFIDRNIIENKWIKSFHTISNYGGIPTYINSSESLLLKIINKETDNNFIYSIIIHSNGEINIIIDDHYITKIKNSNTIDNYHNYINHAKSYIYHNILPIINRKYIILKSNVIDDVFKNNIIINNEFSNPIQIQLSNIFIRCNIPIVSINKCKQNLEEILKCSHNYIRYTDTKEIIEHNKQLDTNHTIYCQWIRISNYNSMNLRCSIIIKQINAGKSHEQVIEFIMNQLNINEEDANKSYNECISLLDEKKEKFNYIRESGVDIKIKIETNGLVISLENLKSIYDYNNLISYFNSIVKIYNDQYDAFMKICHTKSVPRPKETVKTPRSILRSRPKEKVKTPRSIPKPVHKSVPKEKVKTPRAVVKPISKEKSLSPPLPEESEESEEEEDIDAFDMGGGTIDTVYNISEYYIKRLKIFNKNAYGFKPNKETIYDTNYTRLCQNNANYPGWYYKHPIVITKDEKKFIDDNKESNKSYTNYGLDEHGLYYIAPEFWDLDRGISIRRELIYPQLATCKNAEELEKELSKQSKRILIVAPEYANRLIPYKQTKGTTNKTILQRKDYNWFIGKNKIKDIFAESRNGSYKNDLYIYEIDKSRNPFGLTMFCCGTYKDKKTDNIIKILEKKTSKKTLSHAISKTTHPKKQTTPTKHTTYASSIVKGSTKIKCEPINAMCRLTPNMCKFIQQSHTNTDNVFVKIGIKQSNSSIIQCIIHILNYENNSVQNNTDTIHFSESDIPPEDYVTLNNGLLFSYFTNIQQNFNNKHIIHDIKHNKIWSHYKQYCNNINNHIYLIKLYKSYSNFIRFINDSQCIKEDIYLTAFLENYFTTNLEKKLKNNITIIIFEIINDKITIKTPLKGSILNNKNDYLFIVKYKSIYEPILFKSIRDKPIYIFKNNTNKYNIINILVDNINYIINNFNTNDITTNDITTNDINTNININDIISIILKLPEDFMPTHVYINNNNQMTHLLCKNKLLLPISPCYKDIKRINNEYDSISIKPIYHIQTNQLLHYAEFYKHINNSSFKTIYNIDSLCIDNNNKVIQVIVNKYYIPLKPTTYLKKQHYSHKIIYNNKNLFNIDTIINKDIQNNNNNKYISNAEFIIEIYNEYVILFINTINSKINENDITQQLNTIINDPIIIYNDKIKLLYPIIENFNKSKNINDYISVYLKSHNVKIINNIIYKFVYNLVNHGLNITKLLNIKPIDYTHILNNIDTDNELYFTLENMQSVLDNVFNNNPYSTDNIVKKYHKKKSHIYPSLMVRENINYFNTLLSGDYHIDPYRESRIQILEVISNTYHDNSDIFNDDIITIYNNENPEQIHNNKEKSTIILKLHLLKSLEKFYTPPTPPHIKNTLKNILKPYYAFYNININLQKWTEVISNIPILEKKIESDHWISLFDLKILSLSYGINIIIFTQQNEHMINFLDLPREHNDNPKINAVKILLNDIKTSKYLILSHRLFVHDDPSENTNLLATFIINDKQIIPFNELSHNLQELISA